MKRNRKKDEAAAIDMNDTLVATAERRLKDHHVASKLAAAIDNWPDAIDEMLHDGGAATSDYRAIAEGYLRDAYSLTDAELDTAVDQLVAAAHSELKANQKRFDDI
ncbi:hypothetical protein [Lacticaseibacillus sharpeae]|nr:hypothetical protein [Lacticaseibacillus sharpeae]